MNPPFIAAAIQGGAILTAQYSTSTGFMLFMSWPMLEGIPHLEVCNANFGDAMMEMERAAIENEQQGEEMFE